MYIIIKSFDSHRNASQIDDFRNCSARSERKNIYMETTKEKANKYINGANVTRIMHL